MRLPARLGAYELTREIARGGMGAVYEANDQALGRVVAVKVLALRGAEELERFEREAEAIAALNHPGVLRVHAASVEQGLPYLVMELVPGESLAERLKRDGPLPPAEACGLMARVARAVQHAHEQGVLHRDLKPANVLLGEGGPLLCDFGLAKLLGAESLTVSGAIMGTPAYMAPEQAKASGPYGPATDVYGLGATLYALLTGRPPFVATSLLATLGQVASADPVPPSSLSSQVGPELDALVLRALSKDPALRHPSAGSFAQALEAIGVAGPKARSALRPAVFACVLAVACALVGALAGSGEPRRGQEPVGSQRPESVGADGGEPGDDGAGVPGDDAEETAQAEPIATEARQRWRRASVQDSPPTRTDGRLAYDPKRGVTWLYGGRAEDTRDGKTYGHAQLWSWDGQAWLLKPTASGPGGRESHGLVFDPKTESLLLLGGHGGSDTLPSAGMWSWGGESWTRLDRGLPGRLYLGRGRAGLASGPSGLYLYGGITGVNPLEDFYVESGEGWAPLETGANGPGKRSNLGLAYDAARGVLVLLAGAERGVTDSPGLWEWSDGRWEVKALARGMRVDGGARSLVYAKGTCYAFLDSALFGWDGVRWTKFEEPGGPGPRERHCLAYDSRRDVLVLFGGVELDPRGRRGRFLDETWEYDLAE